MSDRRALPVVADTNIVISGLLWPGPPREVLELARAGSIALFTSPALLAELADVLGRERLRSRLQAAEVSPVELVSGYSALAILVEPVAVPAIVAEDPDDDEVLACGVTARAKVIVSGDHHLLSLGGFAGIEILTARGLLERTAAALG